MDEVVLTDMAEVDDHKINLEDKDTITAFLRGQVSHSSGLKSILTSVLRLRI